MDDLLTDPHAMQFNEETHHALIAHQGFLTQLINNPGLKSATDVVCPVRTWMKKELEQAKRQSAHLITPPRYHVSDTDLCRIQNWIITHIEAARQTDNWMKANRLAVYHACTVLLAFRLWAQKVQNSSSTPVDWDLLIQEAWNYQSTPPTNARDVGVEVIDVDIEAIRALEYSMFEQGNGENWGLDTDAHQGEWDPYGTYQRVLPPRTTGESHVMHQPSPAAVEAPAQKKVTIV